MYIKLIYLIVFFFSDSFNMSELAPCQEPIDLVFAVDASSDLKFKEFEEEKNFVYKVASGFSVSESSTHVGVVTYGHSASADITFRHGSDMNRLLSSVRKLQKQRLGHKIHTALTVARRFLFGSRGNYTVANRYFLHDIFDFTFTNL